MVGNGGVDGVNGITCKGAKEKGHTRDKACSAWSLRHIRRKGHGEDLRGRTRPGSKGEVVWHVEQLERT